MNPTIITVLIFCVAIMALAVMIRFSWDKWRKNGIIEAGKSLGFRHLAQTEKLPVELAALIHKDSSYFLILAGELDGYEAGYFDLYISSGEDWFYQSAVMVKNPRVNMPLFQLKSSDWSRVIRQKTCGDELDVPGRGKDMGPLRLSSEYPQWAVQTFSKATPQFFQKLREGKWTIKGFQHSLYVYRWGKTIYPWKMREYVRQAGEIAAEMYSLCS
jgi:hypothetical protein